MRKDQFFRLQRNERSWQNVKDLVAYRRFRQDADDIHTTKIVKDNKIVKKEKVAPWLV